jgi:hypothetical protein
MSPDLIAGALGFVFTLLIFSYVLGDNPLFRIATYIFIGVTAGYIAAVAFWQVLWPDLFYPLFYTSTPQNARLSVPLVLIGLMLMKVSPRTTHFGAPAMAFMVGVGAAVALGGAVIGTLVPQAFATVNAFDLGASANAFGSLFNGSLILIGTVSTLVYFHFGARAADDGLVHRPLVIEWIAAVGRVFIAITLGALFAGVYIAALTALVERLFAVWDFIASFIQ